MSHYTYRLDDLGDGHGAIIKHWTEGVLFEDEARRQIENMSKMPFIYPHIAVMPDVHKGIGAATVGSVVPTKGAVIPSAVGVDIGCGMKAIRLPIRFSQFPTDHGKIRHEIERVIPAGRTNHGGSGDRGAWHDIPAHHAKIWDDELRLKYQAICDRHPIGTKSAVHHLGTLGTGNHFLEICCEVLEGDAANCSEISSFEYQGEKHNSTCPACHGTGKEDPYVWIVLHSGSRGVGNKFGSYFIELARKDMEKYFINLPDKDLAYLPEGTDHFADYVGAVSWAQEYALLNRELMMLNVVQTLSQMPEFNGSIPCPMTIVEMNGMFEMAVNCHHNYLARENHGNQNVLVTRKGAVRARVGDLAIIPGSMGARTYIVEGLGNVDSLNSCSHGAGREKSRTKATNEISLERHQAVLQGVECDKSTATLDESPDAYKPIDKVMEAQKDLVKICHILKQFICVKGISEEDDRRRRKSKRKS
jgi:tRNA-splicing ligase RtcB